VIALALALLVSNSQLWSDVIVREGGGQGAVGLGEQRFGLGLEGLHGVCAGGEGASAGFAGSTPCFPSMLFQEATK
jgi:hypothetical protein